MEDKIQRDSRFFEVIYSDLNLEFELFEIDYIVDKLQLLKKRKIISSFERIEVPQNKIERSLKSFYIDEKLQKEKYHYFAYIKFFEYNNKFYGLVGGKTNYPVPDVSLDYLQDNNKDNRIARAFLKHIDAKWHNEIIIVNHKPLLDKEKDERQALFIECFLQRQFNLFNS